MRIASSLAAVLCVAACTSSSDALDPACPGAEARPAEGHPALSSLHAEPTAMRRLSRAEYANAIRDVFDVEPDALDRLPDDEAGGPALATAFEVDVYRRIAEEVADAAVPRLLHHCEEEQSACWVALVEGIAHRTYRRALLPETLDALAELFVAGNEQGGAPEGLRWAIEALLQSPHFLYEVRTPIADDASRLGDWALASRLAFFLWEAPPDCRLLARADAAELADPQVVAQEVDRMLQHPHARAAFVRRFRAWAAPELGRIVKSEVVFPAFGVADETAMIAEVDAFAGHVFDTRGGLSALLLDALPPEPDLFEQASTPEWDEPPLHDDADASRFGFLTLRGFLAAKAAADASSPVRRGKFISEALLCREQRPPPPGLLTPLGEPVPNVTTRERYERHSEDPRCAPCHATMDPLGFALEHYDGVGNYRAFDNGRVVDASGTLGALGIEASFRDARQMVELLVASPEVLRCWSGQLAEIGLGPGVELELPDIDPNTPVQEILRAIAMSDEFTDPGG